MPVDTKELLRKVVEQSQTWHRHLDQLHKDAGIAGDQRDPDLVNLALVVIEADLLAAVHEQSNNAILRESLVSMWREQKKKAPAHTGA